MIKIVNSYSKWPPLAHTQSLSLNATHQLLNYATHQLEELQLLSEVTALNFQYWDVYLEPSP